MFATSNIVLAAYLRCNGLELHKIEMNGAKGTFFFEAPEEMINDFDLGHARVEPNRFNSAVRELNVACNRKKAHD